MSTRNQWAFILCLCLLMALAGCHRATSKDLIPPVPTAPSPPAYVDPIAFHEAIGNADGKLYDASTQVGYALRDVIADKPGSMKKLDAAYAVAQNALSEENTLAKTIKVPDDPSSQALFAAFQKYLKGQNILGEHEMAQTIKVAKNKKLSAKEKWKQVLALLTAVKQKGEADLNAFQTAERTFAAEHHMLLR